MATVFKFPEKRPGKGLPSGGDLAVRDARYGMPGVAPGLAPERTAKKKAKAPALKKARAEIVAPGVDDQAAREEALRKQKLAKVHVALNGNKARGTPGLYVTLPGFDRDTYEYVLQERWGVSSSAAMNPRQLHELLLYLGGLGFQFTRGRKTRGRARNDVPSILEKDASGLGREALMGKVEALLAEKGRVEGTHLPWGYAVGILKRQTQGVITCFEHASPQEIQAVIAALMRDAKRKGRRVR